MKTVIIDGTLVDNEHLKNVLLKVVNKTDDIRIAETIREGCELIKSQSVDLVFLNTNLYEETSFKLLRKYKERNFEVVFILEESAELAFFFEERNLQYITKPFEEGVIEKVLNKIRAKMTAGIFEEAQGKHGLKVVKRIALKERDGIRFIDVDQIKRCTSDNNYTEIYLDNGERILSTKTLKEHAKTLEPLGFYRVHQSHLVDLKRIEKIISKGGLFVKLKTEDLIELSRRRKDELLRRLAQLEC